MKKRAFDIWGYRDARYQQALVVDSEKEIAIRKSAETIKSTLIEAIEVAKKKRQ